MKCERGPFLFLFLIVLFLCSLVMQPSGSISVRREDHQENSPFSKVQTHKVTKYKFAKKKSASRQHTVGIYNISCNVSREKDFFSSKKNFVISINISLSGINNSSSVYRNTIKEKVSVVSIGMLTFSRDVAVDKTFLKNSNPNLNTSLPNYTIPTSSLSVYFNLGSIDFESGTYFLNINVQGERQLLTEYGCLTEGFSLQKRRPLIYQEREREKHPLSSVLTYVFIGVCIVPLILLGFLKKFR